MGKLGKRRLAVEAVYPFRRHVWTVHTHLLLNVLLYSYCGGHSVYKSSEETDTTAHAPDGFCNEALTVHQP